MWITKLTGDHVHSETMSKRRFHVSLKNYTKSLYDVVSSWTNDRITGWRIDPGNL